MNLHDDTVNLGGGAAATVSGKEHSNIAIINANANFSGSLPKPVLNRMHDISCPATGLCGTFVCHKVTATGWAMFTATPETTHCAPRKNAAAAAVNPAQRQL